jgi:hypothetical protein
LSVGVSGIKTVKCPSSELNFTQPLSSLTFGAGVLVGVDGLLECSWALMEKLNPSVISDMAKNLFIF